MGTFTLIIAMILLVFFIQYGSASIHDEEEDINKFLKAYNYHIQTVEGRTILIKIDVEQSGSEGRGLKSFVMFYKLLYIAVMSENKEKSLQKIFEKSSRIKDK